MTPIILEFTSQPSAVRRPSILSTSSPSSIKMYACTRAHRPSPTARICGCSHTSRSIRCRPGYRRTGVCGRVHHFRSSACSASVGTELQHRNYLIVHRRELPARDLDLQPVANLNGVLSQVGIGYAISLVNAFARTELKHSEIGRRSRTNFSKLTLYARRSKRFTASL